MLPFDRLRAQLKLFYNIEIEIRRFEFSVEANLYRKYLFCSARSSDVAQALAFSLLAVREPILTSCPSWVNFVPMAFPTVPVPSTAIFILGFLKG